MEVKKPKTINTLLSSASLKTKDNKPSKKEVVKRGGSLNYNQHDFLRHPSAHNLYDQGEVDIESPSVPQTFNNVNIILAIPEDDDLIYTTTNNNQINIINENNKQDNKDNDNNKEAIFAKRADTTPKAFKSNSLSLAFSPQQKILDDKITNCICKGCDYKKIESTFSLYHKFKE